MALYPLNLVPSEIRLFKLLCKRHFMVVISFRGLCSQHDCSAAVSVVQFSASQNCTAHHYPALMTILLSLSIVTT